MKDDLDISEFAIQAINKENWRKAKGVDSKGQTNFALAPRDYNIKCDIKHKICYIKGYHIWWCSAHHQPYDHCCSDKELIELKKVIRTIVEK